MTGQPLSPRQAGAIGSEASVRLRMAHTEIETLKAAKANATFRTARAEADNRRLLVELERAEAKLTGLLVEIRDATVTVAQVEAAAKALVWHTWSGCVQWDDDPTDTATSGDPGTRAHARTLVRECFRAAGYRMEDARVPWSARERSTQVDAERTAVTSAKIDRDGSGEEG